TYHLRGDLEAAEPLYQQAIDILKRAGPTRPDYAQALYNLGDLYLHKGDYSKAEPLLGQALFITRMNLELVSLIQSERQQLVTSINLRSYLHSYLALAV